MAKYFDSIAKGWLIINARTKKDASIPLFLLTIAGILQAAGAWGIAEFFDYFFRESFLKTFRSGLSFGTALMAAITILVFLSFADRGKSLNSLSWCGEFLGKWQETHHTPNNLSQYYNILMINAVLVCKVLCIVTLMREEYSFWILYAIALSYAAMVAGMSRISLYQQTQKPELETFTVVGAFILLTCFFHEHFIPAIMAIVAAFLFFTFLFKFIVKKFDYMGEELVRAQAEIVQCLVLLIGLIFIN